MKPNWKDYLLGGALILGIIAFVPALFGIMIAVGWFANTFPVATGVITIGALAAIAIYAMVGVAIGFAQANAEDRYFSNTIQTSHGRLTFPELIQNFEYLSAISYDELDHLTTAERLALIELMQKNPQRAVTTSYWKSSKQVHWDRSETFKEILHYLSQRFPKEMEEQTDEA